jgi:hypothetical protein
MLNQLGLPISANTVARVLHDMNYTLRVNHKELACTSSPERNQQFEYISSLRTRFVRQRLPMIIRATHTKTGLAVNAYLDRTHYPTDTAPAPEDIRQLRLNPHDTLPSWNYTITPNL